MSKQVFIDFEIFLASFRLFRNILQVTVLSQGSKAYYFFFTNMFEWVGVQFPLGFSISLFLSIKSLCWTKE